ncbi:hypothetical protein AS589_09495 [Empedobacter brevis]|uniref:hypothetical protein n=1 Tax=Empedobacter brevis TaxID=247 RepID=UPI00131FB4F5|nr:hypothetical protein [Empedobacter brevis]QHC84989.1 hypothetical protein AS589_09495 [Empedobacter brevis]
MKEVDKSEIKTENVIKNDSVFQLNSKVSKIETNQSFNEFESVLKALDIQYDGEQGNDLKVILNRTEKGTELNVSGKGKANYNEQSEKTKSLTRNDVVNILDSIIDARLTQNKQERGRQLVDSFKSDTQKEKSDVSFWIYVVIGSVLVVWVGIKQIKK